jgi:hypothetical protein
MPLTTTSQIAPIPGVWRFEGSLTYLICEWLDRPLIPHTPYLRSVMKPPQNTQSSQNEGRVVFAIMLLIKAILVAFSACTAYPGPYPTFQRRVNGSLRDTIPTPPLRRYQHLNNGYVQCMNEAYDLELIL